MTDFKIPESVFLHNVQTRDEVQHQQFPFTVFGSDTLQSRSAKSKSKAFTDEASRPVYHLPSSTYTKLCDRVAAALVVRRREEVWNNGPSIVLRTSNFVEGLELVVSHLAKKFEASVVSLDASDLYTISQSFNETFEGDECEKDCSCSSCQPRRSTRPDRWTAAEFFFGIRCNRHSQENIIKRNKAAIKAVLQAAEIKSAKKHDEDAALGFARELEALFEYRSNKEEGVKKESAEEAKTNDGANDKKEETVTGEEVTGDGSTNDSPETDEAISTTASSDGGFVDVLTPEEQSGTIAEKPKTQIDYEDVLKEQANYGELLKDGNSNGLPLFIHLRNANEILKIGTTGSNLNKKLLTRFFDRIIEHRREGKRIVLFVSLAAEKAPFVKRAESDDGTETQNTNAYKRLRASLAVDSASSFAIPTPEVATSTGGRVDSTFSKVVRYLNVQSLKRRISQEGYHDSRLLRPLYKWNFLEKQEDLAYLAETVLTSEAMEKIVKNIMERTTARDKLHGGSVIETLKEFKPEPESEPKDVNEEDDKKTDVEAVDAGLKDSTSGGESKKSKKNSSNALKKLLKSIESDCNDFEKSLLNNVVDPDKLQAGYDDVVIDAETKIAMKQLIRQFRFRPSANKSKGKDSDKLKKKQHPLLRSARINGALFYGPPGTGKTHLSRAIARDSGANMVSVDAAAIESKYVGETEKHIRAVFSLAAKLYPCVLFIDEVDALFRRRKSDDRSWERSALTQFLSEMDGLGNSDRAPFVLVATNRPSDMDDAFLRRLPHRVMFKLPDRAQRMQIFRGFLMKEGYDDILDPTVTLDGLADATKGFSGSDIQSVCAQAVLAWGVERASRLEQAEAAALTETATAASDDMGDEKDKTKDISSQKNIKGKEEEEEEEEDVMLMPRHFEKALLHTKPTVTERSMRDLQEFKRQFSTGGT